MLRRFIVPAAAAAIAVMATAPLVADHASAQRIAPVAPLAGNPVERLRAENQALRHELQVALDQRDEIADGLDRIEQLARSSRDVRTSRRILAFIHDLEARTGLDERWDYDDWYSRPDAPPSPGYPSSPPGYPSSPPPPSMPPSTPPGYPQPPVVVPPPSYPRGSVVVTDRRTQAGMTAMAAADFSALLATVNGAGFTEQQLSIVRGAAERSYFTADQVVALMGAARFEEARIEIAVVLGNRVVDMDRWFLIERAFAFSDSSATVRARLGR